MLGHGTPGYFIAQCKDCVSVPARGSANVKIPSAARASRKPSGLHLVEGERFPVVCQEGPLGGEAPDGARGGMGRGKTSSVITADGVMMRR